MVGMISSIWNQFSCMHSTLLSDDLNRIRIFGCSAKHSEGSVTTFLIIAIAASSHCLNALNGTKPLKTSSLGCRCTKHRSASVSAFVVLHTMCFRPRFVHHLGISLLPFFWRVFLNLRKDIGPLKELASF